MAWLALGLGAVQLDKLGTHAQLIELGFFLETGSMILGAAICSSRPRMGALLLLLGSFAWAASTALVASDNLLVPAGPLALGILAAILAVPRRRARVPTRRAPTTIPTRQSKSQPPLIEPQFGRDRVHQVQWQRTEQPLRYRRRRRSGWLGVVGTVVVVAVGAGTAFAVVLYSDPVAPVSHAAPTIRTASTPPKPKAPRPASTPPSLSGGGMVATAGVNATGSLALVPQPLDALASYRSGDKAGAIQIWTKQALQGDASAQLSLANMYQNGDGTARDFNQAAVWFQKAASQGVVEAATGLGTLYYLGSGVPQDYGTALHWFEQAAAGGDALAQLSLGQMYRYGQGAPVDLVASWAWLEIAAEAGQPDAVKFGSEVYDVMTGAQIEQAKKLVLSWRTSHPLKK